MTNWL